MRSLLIEFADSPKRTERTTEKYNSTVVVVEFMRDSEPLTS